MPKKKKTTKKTVESELKKDDFRIAIFGSARIKKNDVIYKNVFRLAEKIGHHGFDVVTGGGPGLMEAANAGHEKGDPKHKSDSIGLVIKLPWENKGNKHLDIQKSFQKFSNRLDNFMALSNVVVVMPGGIGTCLELFYTWQLIQVKHIHPIPVILLGNMWEKLIDWVKKYPLKHKLISPENLDHIYTAKTPKQALDIILSYHKIYKKTYKRIKKYKIN